MLNPDAPLAPPTLPSQERAASLRAAYLGLCAMGWSETEAANLAAHLVGLAPARKGWRIGEIEGLLFIRALATDGRISS